MNKDNRLRGTMLMHKMVHHLLLARGNPDVWNLAEMDTAYALAVEFDALAQKEVTDKVIDELFRRDDPE